MRKDAYYLLCYYIYAYIPYKIPIIRPGLTFALKAVLLGLFSGELIFGGGLLLEGILSCSF